MLLSVLDGCAHFGRPALPHTNAALCLEVGLFCSITHSSGAVKISSLAIMSDFILLSLAPRAVLPLGDRILPEAFHAQAEHAGELYPVHVWDLDFGCWRSFEPQGSCGELHGLNRIKPSRSLLESSTHWECFNHGMVRGRNCHATHDQFHP